MNLPNYFLADLPPEATLSSSMVREACLTLKRNRERYLAGRSTQSLVSLLSTVAKHWLDPDILSQAGSGAGTRAHRVFTAHAG